MTTTTVLLRAIARLCHADAAVVSVASDLAVFGVAAAVAVDAVACLRANRPLPADWKLVVALPLELHARPAAAIYVLSRAASALQSFDAEALRIIGSEIAYEIDDLRGGFDLVMTQIAGGIDSLNDPALVLELSPSGNSPRILYVNGAFEQLFGYGTAQAVGQTSDLLHGPLTDVERVNFVHERVREMREARTPLVYYRRDGVPVWVELSLRAVGGEVESAACIVATMRDVTMRKEFELAISKEKRKLQVTLAAIGDGVITTIADGRVDFVNEAARTIFGIDAAEAYGESIGDVLRLKNASGGAIGVVDTGAVEPGVRRGQALFERGTTVKHIAYVTSPIAAEGYVVVLRDVTAQHRWATQLTYEASHDPLTNMYNRRKFDELLDDAIDAAVRQEGPHALAFLDLDRFKAINDSCGHAVGDRVLLELAHLLQAQLRGRDVLARIGGDEFAVLLHECSLDNARRVLEKLRAAVDSYRVLHRGVEYGLGVSIGVAAIDGSEADARAIFSRADVACYAAKSGGRNAVAG